MDHWMDGDAFQFFVATYKGELMKCSDRLVEILFRVSYQVEPVFREIRDPWANGAFHCAPTSTFPSK